MLRTNELLEMRYFLKGFNGDFVSLFGGEESGSKKEQE
jgi:hypothetical protein